MEEVYDANNKLVVLFNGQPLLGCFHDTDCAPINALCYLNHTWAAYPSMCACPSPLIGADCTERSVENIARTVFDVITLVIMVPLIVIGLWDLSRIARKHYKRRKYVLNVVEATSVFATLACLSIPLVVADFIYTMPKPRTKLLVINDRITKQPPYTTMSAGYVLAFFFLSLSLLNTTLLWLSIAYDAQRVRHSKGNFILRYKYALLTYYVIFGVSVVAFAVIDRTDLVYYVGIPAIVVVIVTCFFGWFKLKFELAGFGSESHGILQKVERTAFFLALSCTVGLVFALISFLGDKPDSTLGEPSKGIFWLCIAFTQVAVVSFTHPALFPRSSSAAGASSSKNSSTSKNKDANLGTGTGSMLSAKKAQSVVTFSPSEPESPVTESRVVPDAQ